MERRTQERYEGYEEDIALAKAHLLEKLEQLRLFWNEMGGDDINKEINQIYHDYNNIHRLSDLEKGREHLLEIVKKFKYLVRDNKAFDKAMTDLAKTEEALSERLVEK